MEKCDKAVMGFLAATDVGKFPPKTGGGVRAGGFSLISSLFLCIDCFQMLSFVRRGRRVAGVELRHLAGQPGGRGD
jgi:hypothetical protein